MIKIVKPWANLCLGQTPEFRQVQVKLDQESMTPDKSETEKSVLYEQVNTTVRDQEEVLPNSE